MLHEATGRASPGAHRSASCRLSQGGVTAKVRMTLVVEKTGTLQNHLANQLPRFGNIRRPSKANIYQKEHGSPFKRQQLEHCAQNTANLLAMHLTVLPTPYSVLI